MQTTTLNPVIGQTLVANAVSLTTATAANVLAAPIYLGPGTWELDMTVNFIPAATTSITVQQFGANTTSATLPTVDTGLWKQTVVAIVPTAAQTWSNTATITLTVTTAVYLVAAATFTVSTMTCSGIITAKQLVE